MKALFLAGSAMIAIAAPASSAVVSLGNSHARACYLAADARSGAFDALMECDTALTEALKTQDVIATHVNRGIVRMIRDEDAGAMADFDRAIAMNPNQGEAWLNRGILVLKQGNSREAMSSAERALELNTKRPAVAHYIRAIAYEDAGNVKAAYADLQRAAELAPGWMAPKQELRRYRLVR